MSGASVKSANGTIFNPKLNTQPKGVLVKDYTNLGNPLPPFGSTKDYKSDLSSTKTNKLNVVKEVAKEDIDALKQGLHLKPEIIFSTQFKPIWEQADFLSPEGQKFELQIETLRKIESDSIEFLKQTVGTENIKQTNDYFKVQIDVLRNKMKDLRKNLSDYSWYKESLNILDERYLFLPKNFLNENYPNNETLVQPLSGDYSTNLRKALISARNITNSNQNNLINQFSSTKLFLICLRELLYLTQGHSNELLKNKDNSFLEDPLPNSNIKYDLRYFEDERLDVLKITAGIPDVLSNAGSGYGERNKRFKEAFSKISENLSSKLNANLNGYNRDNASQIGLLFYLCFNHMIRKDRRFIANATGLSDSYLSNFIGYYPKDNAPKSIGIAAYAANNSYTGDKLSDLAFFRSVKNPATRVLVLENYDSLFVPKNKKIETGMNYLFPPIVDALNDNNNNINDFLNFLNSITDSAFKNFSELEILPLTNDEVLNLGKSYSSLDPYNAFIQLFDLLIDEDGKFIVEPYPQNLEVSTPHSRDIIALLCASAQGSRQVVERILYETIMYKITGTDINGNVNTSFYKNRAADLLVFLKSIPKDKAFGAGSNAPIISANTDYRTDEQWKTAFEFLLKDGGFVNKITGYFSQFLDFDPNARLLLFYSFIKAIVAMSTIKVFSVNEDDGKTKLNVAFYVFDSNEKKNNLLYKNNVLSTIRTEQKRVFDLTFATLNFLQTFRENIKLTKNTLNNIKLDPYLNRYIPANKITTLVKESQLLLASSTVEDLHQSYNGFSSENADGNNLFVKREENISHSTRVASLMRTFFNSDEFTSLKGYNKQIISVAIPQDLFVGINNILKEKYINNYKHNDIFRIKVYKMDLLNPYIIYKPKSFLFEASRFPVRVYSILKNVELESFSVKKILPTRNYSLTDLSESDASTISDDIRAAFDSNHDFLTDEEKTEILMNHSTSFILENYLKVMSGLNVNELTFNLATEDEIELLYKSLSGYGPDFQSVQLVQNDAPSPFIEQVSAITSQNVIASKEVQNALKLIPIPDSYIKKLVQPKKFDRVFNIIFDPEFEVDVEKMNANLSSENSDLKSLVSKSLEDPNRFFKTAETLGIFYLGDKYSDKDKTPNDISFNTYFVTLETHAQAPILT